VLVINKDKKEEEDGHRAIKKTQRSPQNCTNYIFISTGAAELSTVEEAQASRKLHPHRSENKACQIVLSTPAFNCHSLNFLDAGRHHKAWLSTGSSDSSYQAMILKESENPSIFYFC